MGIQVHERYLDTIVQVQDPQSDIGIALRDYLDEQGYTWPGGDPLTNWWGSTTPKFFFLYADKFVTHGMKNHYADQLSAITPEEYMSISTLEHDTEIEDLESVI